MKTRARLTLLSRAIRVFSTLIVMACFGSFAYADDAANTDLMARIEKSWKQRQERYNSATATWHASHVVPVGAHGHRNMKGEDKVVPQQITVTNQDLKLTLCGKKSHLESRGDHFRISVGAIVKSTSIFATTGETIWHCNQPSDDPLDFPFVTTGRGDRNNGLPYYALPVKMALRPLDDVVVMPVNLAAFREVQRTKINSRDCIVLESTPAPSQTERLLLTADDSFSLVSHSLEYNGKPVVRTDCTLSDQGRLLSWKFSAYQFDSKKLLDEGEVRNFEVVETPCPEAKFFEPEIPVTALVSNGATGEYYILRPNGVKRHIVPAEQKFGIDYWMLANSEPSNVSSGRPYLLYAAIGFVPVAIIFGIVLYKRGSFRRMILFSQRKT